MKMVIAQCGPANAGKTTTVKTMYGHLREQHPDAVVEHLIDSNDISVVFTIGGIRVGIESQGDPSARLIPSLTLFLRLECEVIICATRTWGATVDAVRHLENEGYSIVFRRRAREVGVAAQEKRNRAEAQWMIEQIESMFATATA